MAPRIKNISADEFRRLFQAPSIQQSGFSVSDAINLQNAIEQRRTNDLKQRQSIASIERTIAKEEAEARDVETLAVERGTAAEREAREVAREGIDPTQAGPEEGPFEQDDIAAIEQAKQVAQARVRLDPQGAIEASREIDPSIGEVAAKELELPEGTPRKDVTLILNQRKTKQSLRLAKQKAADQKKKSSIDLTKEAGKLVNLRTQTANLTQLLERIPSIPFLGLAAKATRGRSFLGLGKEALAATKLYNAQVPTIAVSAYRTISQDQRINNEDARDRALPLFPETGEPQDVRGDKIEFLNTMFDNARQINAAQQKNLIDPTQAAQRFLGLENRLLLRASAIQQLKLENKKRESKGQKPLTLNNSNIAIIESQLLDEGEK